MDAPEQQTPDELISDLLISLSQKARYLQLTDEEARLYIFGKARPYAYAISHQDWEALQSLLADEVNKRHLDSVRHFLEEIVREAIVTEWIEKNVNGTEIDKRRLKSDVEFHLRDGREADLRAYLSDVLEIGLKKAQQKQERKLQGDGGYVGHVWVAVQGLVRLGIVVGVFSVAQTKFETAAFAILVLIYESISNIASGQARAMTGFWLAVEAHFKRIRRLLKEELSEPEREMRHEEEQELMRFAAREFRVRFWIRAGCSSLVWILALWKLLTTIFF
jgi:PHD/YefM family antitoxin component YafN of YafNO toxin-antitoxin module